MDDLAALAITDAVVRLLPAAMGDREAASSDSFYDIGQLSAPWFTRPPEYRGHAVPVVLRSGDHAKTDAWRRAEALRPPASGAPDLLDAEE